MGCFRETKIRILSDEHSRSFQTEVFKAGGMWNYKGAVVCHLGARFILVDRHLIMTYCVNEDVFNRQGFNEIFHPKCTEAEPTAVKMATRFAEEASTLRDKHRFEEVCSAIKDDSRTLDAELRSPLKRVNELIDMADSVVCCNNPVGNEYCGSPESGWGSWAASAASELSSVHKELSDILGNRPPDEGS